jgi:hypothetical protein
VRKLITLNIAAGFILAIVSFYFQYIDIDILLLALTFFSLLVLIFANFTSIFMMWRKYKYFSLIPFAISLIFFPLLVLSGFIGHKIGMYNNPPYPYKYFNEERKKELTAIAEELLQTQDEKVIQVIKKKLRSHRLVVRNINRYSNIVEFNYYRPRIIFAYIFAKDGLPEIYSTKPIITEDDILYWGELVSIIKTENDLSKYSRSGVSFMTETVYPFLVANLDKKFVAKLASLPSVENLDSFLAKNKDLPIMKALDKRDSEHENLVTSQLSKEERLKVIEVLNRHRQISSGLVENSDISWKSSKGDLEFCGYMNLSPSFQVNKHLRQLISDGVISVRDREGHLQVKPNLSDKEIREIEWLQVEIMDFIYGNLVSKTEYWSDGKTRLADNWYFYKY